MKAQEREQADPAEAERLRGLAEIPYLASQDDERKPEKAWKPEDHVRSALTNWLAGSYSVALAITLTIAALGGWASVKEWLQIVLPTLTAILASAIGFYFGSERRSRS